MNQHSGVRSPALHPPPAARLPVPSPQPLLLEGAVMDPAGNLYVTDGARGQVLRVTPEGVVGPLVGLGDLPLPTALVLDDHGTLYISDSGKHQVLKLGTYGRLSTVAGTGTAGFSGDGGPATDAQLNGPWGLALDSQGHLHIADAANHRVRRVTPEGIIATIAGTGTPGFSGDGGPATLAQLDRPLDLTADSEGNLFIVDSLNGRVRQVGQDGVIRTVFRGGGAGAASRSYYPARVAVDGKGNLLVADPFLHRVLVVRGVAA
jgi:DNA-binding beta-propeller fold protein YncE